MKKKVCEHCRCTFFPSRSNQKFCTNQTCRRSRKRQWQSKKVRTDEDYRAAQKEVHARDGWKKIRIITETTENEILPILVVTNSSNVCATDAAVGSVKKLQRWIPVMCNLQNYRHLRFRVHVCKERTHRYLARFGRFFDLIKARHKNKCTIVTSQMSFDKWSGVINNQHLNAVIIDRITVNCVVFNMNR